MNKYWIANVHVIDKIRKREYHTIYNFEKVIKYQDLFNDLPDLLISLDYEEGECKIHSSQVNFSFMFLGKYHHVDDWEKYILNKEKIKIIISTPPSMYYLVDSFSEIVLKESTNMKFLYSYYNNTLKDKIDCPVLLKGNYGLLDVLDNPDNYLNACINRLILKYRY